MRQLEEERATITVKVFSANSCGLRVEYLYGAYQGLGRGFLPRSQFGPVSSGGGVRVWVEDCVSCWLSSLVCQ